MNPASWKYGLGWQPGRAQIAQADTSADSRRITLTATTQDALAESNSLITRMLQAGELTSVRVQDDPQIAGRQTQTLQQVYKGIQVEGGSVTLQKAGPATVSVFGTLFNAISIDPTPAIAPAFWTIVAPKGRIQSRRSTSW